MEELTERLGFEFRGSTVAVVASVGAKLLGVFSEDESATGLTQEKNFNNEKTAVGDQLNLREWLAAETMREEKDEHTHSIQRQPMVSLMKPE